ncbi:MAG: hypothetical protein ACOCWC_04855 [Bacteroidota bacterium]
MNTKNIDLVKIVDEVWKENELHSGTYKIAALTCMQKLQDIYEKVEKRGQALYIHDVNSSAEYTRGYREGWRDCCKDVKEFG